MRYRDVGVDPSRAEAFLELIRRLNPQDAGYIGPFAAVVEVKGTRLALSCDGIGTKIRLALATGRPEHLRALGQDLVAMCVNDILAVGARPLFFLDYYASGRLDPPRAEAFLAGMVAACHEAGCRLVGGETAELPGTFPPGEFEAVGFCVGEVEVPLGPERVRPGDVLLALPSSGPHANGFSLIRRILETRGLALDRAYPEAGDAPLGMLLLAPTKIYVRPVLRLLGRAEVHAAAHITGGGIHNIARVLPEGLCARIDPGAWPRAPLWDALREWGEVPEDEMWGTFNMGIGFVLVLPPEAAARAPGVLGEPAYPIGEVVEGERKVVFR